MKKILPLTIFLFCGIYAFTQQIFVEAYSGYNLTAYSGDVLESTQGYIPLGFKVAGGHEHVQIGIDYRQHITNPTFLPEDISAIPTNPVTQTINETFYGAFIRGNLSSLPAYRFGLIGSVGAGYYVPEINTFSGETTENLLNTVEYDRKLGYNFYLGVSAPIFAQVHWEIGYQYNIIDHELNDEVIRGGNYHSIHVGLSGNFVFGNTEKRCRRVIKQSGKNW